VVIGAGVDLAAVPVGVAAGEDVEVGGDLEVGAGHLAVAGVVLALVGVDVPVAGRTVVDQRLVGIAVAALDRQVAEIDPGLRRGHRHSAAAAGDIRKKVR
jgi:hypothetical protein